MELPGTTSWNTIRAAAAGAAGARECFVVRYMPTIRRVLTARWRNGPLAGSVEDAMQECFIECFKEGGGLERVDSDRSRFRSYLAGIARNVARRYEEGLARDQGVECEVPHAGSLISAWTSVSEAFDRGWARQLVQDAAAEMERQAGSGTEQARRRVELLRLRFALDLPIREIATRWRVDASYVHHQYAKARKTFQECLLLVLRRRHPRASDREVEQLAAQLVELLR